MAYFETLIKWDRIVYHFISKALYHRAPFFFFEVITNVVDVIIFTILVYWLYSLLFKNKRLIQSRLKEMLTPVVITAIMTLILKVLIHRGVPGPLVAPWLQFDFLPVKYAFPSGHSSRAFALATILANKFPSKRLLLFTAATLIGFSRVYIGAHFPLDVIAGAILGVLISYLYVKLKSTI